MSKQDTRLELLKLTYSHGRGAEEAVRQAKILEQYVAEAGDGAVPAGDVVPAPTTLGKPDTLTLPRKPQTVPKHLQKP